MEESANREEPAEKSCIDGGNTREENNKEEEEVVDMAMENVQLEEDEELTNSLADGKFNFVNYDFSLPHKKPWYKDLDIYRIILMFLLVTAFMIAELVVGIFTNSLAMMADAFHMLSDAFSFGTALFALIISKKGATDRFSYGFSRAETVGGLINAVFLVGVSVFIILDAIQRYIDPKPIGNPILVLSVGGAGFLMNLFGIILFCGHAHHGHGHDHGHNHENHEEHERYDAEAEEEDKRKKEHGHRHNENIFALLLHMFGDFFGNIGVMVNAVIVLVCRKEVKNSDRYTQYVDPSISVLISLLILCSAIPTLIRCVKVVLQSVPNGVNLPKLKEDLKKLKHVSSIHELHVWSLLGGQQIIGTVHLILDCPDCQSTDKIERRMKSISRKAKIVFHAYGIHNSTIQLEFQVESVPKDMCNLMCSKECVEDWCCLPKVIEQNTSKPNVAPQ